MHTSILTLESSSVRSCRKDARGLALQQHLQILVDDTARRRFRLRIERRRMSFQLQLLRKLLQRSNPLANLGVFAVATTGVGGVLCAWVVRGERTRWVSVEARGDTITYDNMCSRVAISAAVGLTRGEYLEALRPQRRHSSE